jgi:hypothetical protein
MDKLKTLQVKKLIKELEFIESDYEYRSEIISEADSEFIRSINDFLIQHPDIKDIYDKKINEIIDKSIQKTQQEEAKIEEESKSNDESNEAEINKEESTDSDEVTENNEDKEHISQSLKRLYREIVKLTHPDRVNKKHLNDLYIKATEFYNKNNKVGLYTICNELGVEYDLEDDDENYISLRIDEIKQKIGFLESTFTWKWYNTKSEEEKNQILINYIKLRIQ